MATKTTWVVEWNDGDEDKSIEFSGWNSVVGYVNSEIEVGTPVKVLEQHWQVVSTTPNIWTAPFTEQGE